MNQLRQYFLCGISVFLIGVIGCGSNATKQDPSAANQGHQHAEGDELVWVKKDIEHGGYKITLGHHGKDFHFGDEIEAAAMITKNGKDIGDAVVSNCLLAEGDKKVLVEEKALVFEPETDEEPAHYAQAAMKIPEGAEHFLVQFKIKFPGEETTATFEIEVHAHEAH